jgi:hypothetical protein
MTDSSSKRLKTGEASIRSTTDASKLLASIDTGSALPRLPAAVARQVLAFCDTPSLLKLSSTGKQNRKGMVTLFFLPMNAKELTPHLPSQCSAMRKCGNSLLARKQ